MLLRFRVANHRSIRAEQELSLVAVPKRGEAKPKAGEIPKTVPVAGIYGSNASGKSNVLDALRWMRWAIEQSHTQWQPDADVPRRPFRLDDASQEAPSFYEIDFVLDGVRHSYGFEVTDREVRAEWLFAFPTGRPQRLFEREGPEGPDAYKFGRSLTGELRQIANLTRGNALYLSSAASNNHPRLSQVYRWLTRKMGTASQNFLEQNSRTKFTQKMLENPKLADHVSRLVRVADLGISDVRLEKREVDEDLLISAIKDFAGSDFADSLEKTIREEMSRTLLFTHTCAGAPRSLPINEESDGTRAWVGLVGFVLQVLKNGDVFLVDEIDSSLHPMISSTLITMFKDPVVNQKGAQLVFASHDTTFLGSMLENKLLERDEVWFTEKDAHGATSLFSLAEFHPRGDENTERGYLQGRYGAVPYVNFEEIRSLFTEIHGASDESATESENGPLPAHENA